MMIMENSHNIKFLCGSLHANVGEVKRTVKHCEMMNNQVEQMISLQNQLYEKLNVKKQVCGVNTRTPTILKAILRGKSKKLETKNFLQANLPMKTKIKMILKNKIMISLFLMLRLKITIMKRRNHPHLKRNHKKLKMLKNLEQLRRKTLNHLLRRTRRKTIQIHKEAKRGIHGYKDPYHILKR